MSKNGKQLQLIIGETIHVILSSGTVIIAEAFRTTESGVYVNGIQAVSGPLEKIINLQDLVFIPYQKVEVIKFVVDEKEEIEVPQNSAQG